MSGEIELVPELQLESLLWEENRHVFATGEIEQQKKADMSPSCRVFVMLRGCRVKATMVAFCFGLPRNYWSWSHQNKATFTTPHLSLAHQPRPHTLSNHSKPIPSLRSQILGSRTTSHSHSRLWNHRNVRRPEAQNIGTMSTRRPQYVHPRCITLG